jgi:hypothetical protein
VRLAQPLFALNKRQKKKAAKKAEQVELGRRLRELWEFEPKGDEPCDPKCDSCYIQPNAPSWFR